MSEKKKSVHTYIRGDLSRNREQNVRNHLEHLGFEATADPREFVASPYTIFAHQITANQDMLSDANQLPMHSHTFMEIFLYTSESQVEYLIGSHRYMVRKGDVLCIPPGTFHQVLRYEPRDIPCTRDLLAVGPIFLEYFGWKYQPEQHYLLRSSAVIGDQLGALCSLCIREGQEQKPHWRDMQSSCVQILLTQILRHSDLSVQAEPEGLFEKALSYINNNLSQKLTLADTAQQLFTSQRTLTREFQSHLGISFYRYVTQRRLMMAQNLLLNDVPPKEVYRQVGFADYPTFYRAFKKEYGCSPRELARAGDPLVRG